MGLPNEIHPLQLCASSGAYQINQSLRFDGSAYLNRTPASAGNRKTWTWSGWVKRCAFGSVDNCLFSAYGNGTQSAGIYFSNDTQNDSLEVRFGPYSGGWQGYLVTAQVFRDPSAWYHIVFAADTTQATASDRLKLYVNGSQVTTFNSSAYPSQNTDGFLNQAQEHQIGRLQGNTYYHDGYLAEVNFIDGTALTPSSFGETDTITGAWIPKKYSGSYGTNGFYLKFESSGIGTDSSGNSNTWTANNFSTSGTGTDVMSDTPTNNYVTWNPLTGYGTYSEGNLRGVTTTNDPRSVVSSMSVNGGKWYCEVTCTSITVDCAIGITPSTFPRDVNSRNYSFGDNVTYYSGTGNKHVDGSSSAYGSSYATNDVIGIALDIDNNQLTFYKNGVSQGTISKTFSGFYNISCTSGASADSQTVTLNGGQRSFEYTQPSGFKAWNTANLPEPTIKKGGAYFNTVLYTGDSAASHAITGVGFQPDFLWIKRRNGAQDHQAFDAVRGADKSLQQNATNAESDNDTQSSFDADGFTVTGAGVATNASGGTFVAWNWKANGAGSSNTAGSITSTVSASPTSGFSVVAYTGTGSAATVGHGLGVAPSMVITKYRNAAGYDWYVYHKSVTSGKYLRLNTTEAEIGPDTTLYSSAPSSTVINYGSSTGVVANGGTYVAYCFSEVASFSKFGSYTGNGTTTGDGPFVFCGFKPSLVVLKASSTTDNWRMYDDKRLGYNSSNYVLYPNLNNAEGSSTDHVDILSNGFKLRSDNNNSSGVTYIFMAFASSPFKYANAR